jgi:hypothetical protein
MKKPVAIVPSELLEVCEESGGVSEDVIGRVMYRYR